MKRRRRSGVWLTRVVLPCLVLAGVLGLYLSNGRFVESTDTFGNELLPISILEHGTLTFDQYFAPPLPDGTYPTGDQALVPGSIPEAFVFRVAPELPSQTVPWWFVRVGDHVVSLYPVAPGVLNTPVFFVARLLGVDLSKNVVSLTHVTTSIIATLTVLAMYLCLMQVCAKQRTAVYLTLAFAFGTAVWSTNSRSLYQHGAAALFIATALAALLTRRPRLVALAGLLVGLAVVTRPTNLVLAAALALYVARRERRALAGFAALVAIPAALLLWYSWVYLGTPFALGQGQGASGFTAPEPAVAALGLLISPNRGLLVFSPIFIFSVAYSVYLLRRRVGDPLLRYLIWGSVGLIALYTLWSDWAGGHTYGYRFLIELVPGLTLLLAACWTRVIEPRPYLRALFMVAMLVSIFVHGLGANASPCGFDDEPDNIDQHHERLWDVGDGEIARCAQLEVREWRSALMRVAPPEASAAQRDL